MHRMKKQGSLREAVENLLRLVNKDVITEFQNFVDHKIDNDETTDLPVFVQWLAAQFKEIDGVIDLNPSPSTESGVIRHDLRGLLPTPAANLKEIEQIRRRVKKAKKGSIQIAFDSK